MSGPKFTETVYGTPSHKLYQLTEALLVYAAEWAAQPLIGRSGLDHFKKELIKTGGAVWQSMDPHHNEEMGRMLTATILNIVQMAKVLGDG